MGVTVSLGWYQQLSVNQLTTEIAKLLSDQKQRQQMSEKGKQLVDGLGSQRVIDAMMKRFSRKGADDGN
jgi:UDP-2,4-diacetamido-2,4,6-trideoxy-beta-L-altropyranose hydrolase